MKRLCKNTYWKLNEEYNTDKILYLLIDRPDYINSLNSFYWENEKGEVHRNYDLPVFIRNDGYVTWDIYNKPYRNKNMPTDIFSNGVKKWL